MSLKVRKHPAALRQQSLGLSDTVTASPRCCNIRSRAGARARATVSLPPKLCTAHSSGAAKRTTCSSNCTLVFEAKYLAERRNYLKIFPLHLCPGSRPDAGLSLSESRIAITVTLSTSAAALQRASQLGIILTAGQPRQHRTGRSNVTMFEGIGTPSFSPCFVCLQLIGKILKKGTLSRGQGVQSWCM